MAHRTIRPATTAALIATTIAAVALSACGSSSKTKTTAASTVAATTTTTPAKAPAHAGAAKVAVALSEYKITPAVATAAAGRIAFVVTNDGKIKHQFTVIRTDKPAATALSKHNPDDDIPGARGEIASLAPGATKTLVIKHLKPGHYVFVCALPGHYQSGMYADFTVK
jgi:uncharacterized cupredoxin-like copper-binding protein